MPTKADRSVIGRYHDARDAGRWMQMTWHPAHSVFVLSLWRGDVCAATFHLDRPVSAEIIADLAKSLSTPSEIVWSDRNLTTRTTRLRGRLRSLTSRLARTGD